MCIIGEEAADEEERRPYATDSSVLRARQRAIDSAGTDAADDIRVQRHLRKLSRSLAHRHVQHVRNRYGQLVLPGVLRDQDGRPAVETVTKIIGDSGNKQTVRTIETAGHRRASRHRGAPRKVAYDKVDPATGEIRRVCAYRIGYYQGGSGFLFVDDGRVSGRDIQRLLDTPRRWTLAA